MFKDKVGKKIHVGCKMTDGYNGIYVIKELNGKLYADNNGHSFPLDSCNYNLQKNLQ